MKILYIAKHLPSDNQDELAIAFALEALGHEVCRVQEYNPIEAFKISQNYDFALFHHWRQVDQIKMLNCPKVCWCFDLIDWSDDPTTRVRSTERVRWMAAMEPVIDLCFCTDGDWVLRNNPKKFIRLTQGMDERVAGFGFDNLPTDIKYPILFAGLYNGGKRRKHHLDCLKQRYGNDFHIIDGRQRRHGRDLANLFSQTGIVIAPDAPITANYWSNRIYLTTGLGGFILHPYSKTLVAEYEPGTDINFYHSREELNALIDHYLKNRDLIPERRLAGYNKTVNRHLYRHRCAKLIETIKERLGL